MNTLNTNMKVYFKELTNLSIKLLLRPADFFRAMPKSGGFVEPLLYVVAAAVLGVLLNTIESLLAHGAGMRDLGILFIQLIIVPSIVVILSFFFAGVCFALWSFMGSQENYQTSYRCLAYMHILFPIVVLFSVLPYLGLLGIIWWLYMMVIASREVHKVPFKPALLAFGIIAAIPALVYYSSVSSTLKSEQRLQELTKELQRMPGKNESGNFGKLP